MRENVETLNHSAHPEFHEVAAGRFRNSDFGIAGHCHLSLTLFADPAAEI